jgi:hypothetical protein
MRPLKAMTVNRQKVWALWPVKLPAPDGRTNSWHLTAHEAAEAAMKTWVRIVPNMSLKGYEIFQAESMPLPDRMEKSSVNSTCHTSGTNCTISDGTPAVPPFALMRRIRTWKDAT